MSFSINTNIGSLYSNMYNRKTENSLASSLEKLASGFRINRAADDSAGLAIANQLKTQHMGLAQANNNISDAIGLVKIADGALEEYTELLTKARDKAVAATSDTNSVEARAALEADVKSLMEQADAIAKQTEFNGIKLLDGTFTAKVFQVGSESGQTITMTIDNADAATQNIEDADLVLTTQAGADAAIVSLDAAIKSIDAIRSGIGSTQISLESRARVNEITITNVKAAESGIRDVDMLEESANSNRLALQQQAGMWATSQAQQNQSLIMQLLR